MIGEIKISKRNFGVLFFLVLFATSIAIDYLTKTTLGNALHILLDNLRLPLLFTAGYYIRIWLNER